MGYDAATAIRSYLEEHEGATDANVGQLLTSFEVDSADIDGQAAIEQTLRDHGIELDRSIAGLTTDHPVALRLSALTPPVEETTPSALWMSAAGPQSPATTAAPSAPEAPAPTTVQGPPPPPNMPPPSAAGGAPSGGFSGFIRRRPRAVFWSTLGIALLVGIGIGAAGAADPQVQEDLDQTKAELLETKSDLSLSKRKEDDAAARLATADGRIRELTAKGEVPNLRGKDADSVDTLLDEYDWTLATSRQVSSLAPGTIIAQTPAAGATLKAGKEIQVTVAKATPPSWKSILSLSGSGSKRTDEFNIPAGKKVRVQYSFNGESNDMIQVKDPASGDEDFGDLIFNEIGAKSGTTRLYGAEGPTYLDITGDSWTIDVQVYK